MFICEYPVFIPKHLLKIEMLENLRDYPRDFTDVFFQNYSNGILTGCDLKIKDHSLYIQPGIIVFKHRLYILKEEEKVSFTHEDCQVYLKVKFTDIQKGAEKISYLSQVCLDAQIPNNKDEIELCRFRLQSGNQLRNEYAGFDDFSTKYDTVNKIHVPYAEPEESTVWPFLLNFYAKEILRQNTANVIDVSFCMSVLRDTKAVPRSMIIEYLNIRLHKEEENYENEEIYKELVTLLEQVKEGRDSFHQNSERHRKIMLV